MFDWQTEDEERWEVPPAEMPAPSRPPRRLPLLLALALVLAGSGYLYTQLRQRLHQTQQTGREELLSSYELLQQAGSRGDAELFRGLLSAHDSRWWQSMVRLFDTGYFASRPLFGLLPQPGESQVIDLSLSADLSQAQLTVLQGYRAWSPPDGSEKVTLQRELFFRREGQRWLLAATPAELWGEWRSVSLPRLQLVVRQRDEEWGRKLAGDIAGDLERLCAAGAGCSPSFGLRLRLDDDPASLPLALGPEAWLDAGSELTLPTPSLAGLPATVADYQALRRSYTGPVVAAAIGLLSGLECCEQAAMRSALAQAQLHALYLVPDPAGPGFIEPLWQERTSLTQAALAASAAWGHAEEASNSAPLAALIAFVLEQDPGLSALQLLQAVPGEHDFFTWADRFLKPVSLPVGDPGAEAAWQRFLAERMPAMAAMPEPVPQPVAGSAPELGGQKVALICRPPAAREAILFLYDAGRRSLSPVLAGDYRSVVVPAPRDGLVVSGRQELPGQDRNVVDWWRDGELTPLYAGTLQQRPSVGQHLDPLGRFLPLRIVSGGVNLRTSNILIDLTGCTAGGCPRFTIGGTPLWSPEGDKTLLYRFNDSLLRGDEAGQNTVLANPQAFNFGAQAWLGEEEYVYTVRTAAGEMNLVAHGAAGSERVLLRQEDVVAALGLPATTRGYWVVESVQPLQDDPDTLLLGLRLASDQPERFLLGLQMSQGLLRPIFASNELYGGLDGSFELSPDGRWLATAARAGANGQPVLLLHSRESRQVRWLAPGDGFAGSQYRWSADGHWLAYTGDQALWFFNPDTNELQFVPLAVAPCPALAWMR